MDKEDALALLRSLVISKTETYELTELMKDFKEESGYSLPSFGYKTPLDFLKSVPDTVQIENRFHKIMVKAVNSSKSAHVASLVKRQKVMRKRHMRGSTYYPDIYCDESILSANTDHVKPNISKCIGFHENFKSRTRNQRSTLIKSYESKYKSLRGDYEVDYSHLQFGINHGKCSNHHKPKSESKSLEMGKKIIDDDIIKDLKEIPKLDLRSFAEIGGYIEVCVPAVCTPHNFIIQLRKFKIKLINLMLEIQLFYNKNGDRYKIPASEIRSSLLCVALTETNCDSAQWCRAIILECRDKGNVIVGLLDYGTITEIDINNIQYMHHWFQKLPPQALSGHLANIRSISDTLWSEKCIERFWNLVYEKDLIAGIVELDYEEKWLSVALSFTDGMELHISDTLVEENLAIFDSSVSVSQQCLPWNGNKRVLSLSHPIPKFVYHSKEITQMKNEDLKKKEQCDTNPKQLFFSYSESNVKLQEMFLES